VSAAVARCRGRRIAAALVAAAVSVLVLLVPGPAAAAPSAGSVVIVGVAGLRWDDVDARRTPTLARLARDGSVGALSVRAAPEVTCPGEGWLTLGAGASAALEDPRRTDPAAGCGARGTPPVLRAGTGAVVPTFPLYRRLNDTLRFGADPGLLGAGMGCVSAVGPGAALAGADPAGRLTAYTPELPPDPRRALARCPLAVVDLGALPDGAGRASALARFDGALARVDAARPAGAVLLVAGVAETTARTPRLHVLIAEGPGFRGGWVHAPSTRRTPYAQLTDVGPTALALLGQPVPAGAAGRPLAGGAPGRPTDWPAVLTDADRAATGQRRAVVPFFVLLGVMLVVASAAALLVLRRPTPRAAHAAALACVVVATVPGATFLADLVPGWPGLLAAVAVVTALVVTAYRRWGPTAALGTLGGVTYAVMVADLLTGARLQLDSLFGYNALMAGRFAGIGNLAFAVLGVAALMLAAALAADRRRWTAVGIVTGVAAVTVLADGAPAFGADVGGVLTLVPAFAVLALSVARIRFTALRLVVAGLAGVAVVVLLAAVDLLRPASERTHLGGFAAEVVAGQAGAALRRKLLANLDTLLAGPHSVAALVVSLVLAVLVFRPPRSLSAAYAAVPALRPALQAVVVLGAVGFATNDSGIGLTAVAGLGAVPVALAVCVLVAARDTPPARSVPAGGGVTVNSRGCAGHQPRARDHGSLRWGSRQGRPSTSS
jgi:hypothetical protein